MWVLINAVKTKRKDIFIQQQIVKLLQQIVRSWARLTTAEQVAGMVEGP